jgi:hypothetical protein
MDRPNVTQCATYAGTMSGGPNLASRKLGRPSSTMARRPTDFKSANTIEHIATKGLPEDRHIGPDEKTSKITLTSWVNSTCSYMEERGLDTVFHVYDRKTDSEVYLLTDWGSASPAKIEAWVATLRAGVTQASGTTPLILATMTLTISNGAARLFLIACHFLFGKRSRRTLAWMRQVQKLSLRWSTTSYNKPALQLFEL